MIIFGRSLACWLGSFRDCGLGQRKVRWLVILAAALLTAGCAPVTPQVAFVALHPVEPPHVAHMALQPPQRAPLGPPNREKVRPAVLCSFAATRTAQLLPPQFDPEAAAEQTRAKFGIDPLHPIRIADGALSPLVADPAVVAHTGAGWVRLNFILGPWRSPVDRTRHHGCTWQETYQTIIDGYRQAGVRVYGLISYEAMPNDPGDALRSAPPPAVDAQPWVDDYVATTLRILRIFRGSLSVVETLNEPDDWHGGRAYWIHPGWFAVIQQRIYTAVKNDPALRHITLVSGPLQGMTNNNNGAPRYLRQVYRYGKERFGWGASATPFPFDGVGLHLYLRDRYYVDSAQQSRAIEQLYHRYLGEVQRVVEQEEGALRPIYLSEIGWASQPEDEALQAANLRTVFALIADDPRVALAIWFALQDFSVPSNVMRYGLYRQGSLTPDNRKPAFDAFRMAVTLQP